MKISLRRIENLHIALWLMKDTAWVADWKYFGMLMVLPAVALAFYITWQFRREKDELLHNVAVCCWISANSIWMTGEFFYGDTTRPLAKVFFAAGLLVIAVYYLKELQNFYMKRKRFSEEE